MATIKQRPIWLAPYYGNFTPAFTSQASTADGATKLMLIDIPYKCVIERFAWQNAATVQNNLRVGIYTCPSGSSDDANGGVLLYDSGAIAQSGTNTSQEHILTSQVQLEKGRYYLAFETEGTTMTYMRHSNQAQATGWNWIHTRSGGFGAFAATVPTATASSSAMPGLRIRVLADYNE